jgi:uncharacterized membrane protein
MTYVGANAPHEISQDERTMAILAHVLQVVCSWMAPLTIFLLRRNSPFVKFHALQALLLQICFVLFWMAGVVIFMATMVATMPMSGGPSHSAPPLAMMVVFPVFWLLAMGSWVVVLVLAIVYGIKAGRGEWAGYPLIGRVARHLLKM